MTTPSPAFNPPSQAARLDAAAAVGAWLHGDSEVLRAVIEESEEPRELARCLAVMSGAVLLSWPSPDMRASFLAGLVHSASDPDPA